MFVIKRNQIIVTALVIMIAIAGYLNFVDGNKNDLAALDANTDRDTLGEVIPEDDIMMVTTPYVQNDTDSVYSADDEIDIFGDDYLSIDSTTEAEENMPVADPGAAVFVSSQNDSAYFVNAKLEREQARAKQKEILTEMINNKNIEKDQVAEFAQSMLDIQKRIEKETAAEAMIEAKGFSEVYVRIGDGTVDVVVNKESLSEAELAQIEDIVTRKTGIAVDKIRISPLKK